MKLRTWSFLLWLELVGCTALFGWGQSPTKTWMPIELKHGYLVLAKGSIGRLNNLSFLVDTGTSRTLVDARIAKQLRLTGVANKLTAFDRDVAVKLVILPDLQLGAIHAESPRVIATDLSGVAQRFGLHVDAVIGMDILHLVSFGIDYDSRRIWFGAGEPMASTLPLESGKEPYLVMKVRLGDLPVTLMIDTGFEGVMFFANRLPDGLEKCYSQVSRLLTVAGEAPLTPSGSGTLAAGTYPARKVRFHIVDTGRNDMGFDGLLGVHAIHASLIHFDFERMTVSWK
jgi:predicted aspartyl protease